MPSTDYVNEKLWVAIDCLCSGKGNFEDRLFNAWTSALSRLESSDSTAQIAEELNSVLLLCRNHSLPNESTMKEFTDEERSRISRNLIHVYSKSLDQDTESE